jgi:hypothetical protein
LVQFGTFLPFLVSCSNRKIWQTCAPSARRSGQTTSSGFVALAPWSCTCSITDGIRLRPSSGVVPPVNYIEAADDRVARWYSFKPKILNWVNFGGPYYGKCWNIFMPIWNLLRPFGIFYGHVVIFW